MWKQKCKNLLNVMLQRRCTAKAFGWSIFLCLLIACILFHFSPSNATLNAQGKTKSEVWFGNNWFYGDGERISNDPDMNFISLEKESPIIRIHKMIVEPTSHGDYLCFRTKAKSIHIYKNNTLIYEYTTSHKYAPFNPIAYTLFQIPMSDLKLNDRLTIEIEPVVHPLIIQNFALGEQFEVIRYIVSNALSTILICLCALFLVFLIIAVYSTPNLDEDNKSRKAMFWLASFLILSIIWLITDNGFLELFIPKVAVLYWLGSISVFFLPIPFIIYTKYTLFPNHLIYDILATFNLIGVCISIIAFFMNIYNLSNTYAFIHIVIAISIIISMFLLYKEKLQLPPLVLIATTSLFISAFFSITSYWSLQIFPTSTPFGYGLVIYSIMMFIWTVKTNIQDKKIHVEQERNLLKKAKEDAELANDQKTRFLSHMSHEIRTPLNAVLGMNSLILRESADEQIIHYAENIEIAGHTLLSLINDILDLSKIESGKMDIIPTQYSISSIVHDLVTMLQVRAQEKGLKLELDIDSALPDALFGDEIRIKQIVTNFMTNAVKYTKKGWIKLSIHYESIPKDQCSSFVCEQSCSKIILVICVSDSGIGIKNEDISKLFENFERLDALKNRSIEGSGLGLSITSQLITLMNGTIDVQSIYGSGSSFTARIPQEVLSPTPVGDLQKRFDELSAENKYAKDDVVHFTNKKVLVIDDNELNLEVLSSILDMMGLQVTRSNSGPNGLSKTKETLFDLILTDDMMPELNGTELMQIIKTDEHQLNHDVPIVVVTANAVMGMKESYLAKGFCAYLTKPLDIDQLQTVLTRYLG